MIWGGGVNTSIDYFTIMISVSLVLASCKPHTRVSEQEENVNIAMSSLRYDDSVRQTMFGALPEIQRHSIDSILKSYENATETVVTRDKNITFNVDVTVETTFESGRLRLQMHRYENGTIALGFFPVHDGIIEDSTIRYYPAGQIYSRSIKPTDKLNWVYEKFHENGVMKSKEYPGTTKAWDEKGKLASEFFVGNNEVVQHVYYYPNGTKKKEVQWKNDRFHGPMREWDSLGTLVRNEMYKNGVMEK